MVLLTKKGELSSNWHIHELKIIELEKTTQRKGYR